MRFRVDRVSVHRDEGRVTFQSADRSVELKVCTPEIVNVKLGPLPDLGQCGEIILGRKRWDKIPFTFHPGDPYRIETERLTVSVFQDPFTIECVDQANTSLLKGKETFIVTDDRIVVAKFDIAEDEHFYGLGDGGYQFEKRNLDQRIWTDHIGREGSEITIPLVISSKGYGIFFHSPYEAWIHIDHESGLTYSSVGGFLDLYFLYGPSADEVLKNYYVLMGFPPLLPRWAFGYQQSSRHFINAQELLDLPENLRQREIPCDHLTFLSSYSRIFGREDGWDEPVAHLDFNSRLWPKPREMIERMRSQHFHIMFHQYPQIGRDSPDYEEFERKGYGIADPDGSTVSFSSGWNTAYVDFTNPEAREWWWQKMRRFFEMGVDSWWHDGGEGPETGDLYDGSYEKCHNLFDLFRERLWYENLRQEFPDRRVAIRCRTTFAGAHRYGVMLQPGDMMSGIETLKIQVLRTLSSALSGFPFRGPDMGGHYPDVNADLVLTGRHTFEGTVSQEVYLRWVQFCAFNSIMWSHGQFWRSKLPWMRGPKVEAIVKKYIELRYRLIPYIYSSVWVTCTTGSPFMRALVLDYPGDANVTDLSTQYMFGKSLLVAPVLKEASTNWDVYLPEGIWYDFWTNRAYSGGRWINVRVDLETIPIFVKAGSIIPMGPVMQYVTEKALDPITLLVYPYGRSEFVLYEDDGETYGYEGGEFALTRYSCEVDEAGGVITITVGKPEGSFDGQVKSRDYILRIHSPEEPHDVTVAGNTLSTDVASADHWSYEGENTLMVKMSAVADKAVVVVSYTDKLAG